MADATSRAKFLLEADTRQYEESLKRADSEQKSFAANARSSLGGAFTAVATAGAAAAAALGGIVAQAVANADEIGNQANLLGVASDKLIAYRFAAEDAGSSAEKFDKALRESQRILAEGGKEVQAWTQKLGLSIADLRRQSPDQLFATYADAIAGLNTRGEQFAATQALMGGKAAELTGLLAQGSEHLREAEEMTRRFGAALNDIEIEQLKQVDDSFDKAKLGAQGAANTIALAFGPVIEDVITKFVEATAGSEEFKNGAKAAAETTYVAFRLLGGGLDVVQASLQSVAGTAVYAYSVVEQLVGNGGGAAKLRQTAQSFFDDAKANIAGLKTIEELRGDFERLTIESERRAAEAATLRAQARDAGRAAANGQSVADGSGFELGKLGKLPKFDMDQAQLDRLRILEEGKKGIRDEAYRAEVELQQRRIGMHAEAERSIFDLLLGRHQQEILLEQVKNATVGDTLSNLLSAFGAHSKKMAKVSQALAIAQTIYSTARGVMDAAPNFGLMAAIAAAGASNLAKIRSTSIDGGGGGGSFGSATLGGSPSGVSALANDRQETQASQSLGAQQRPQLTIAFNGPVAGERAFMDIIKKQLDRDVTVIYGGQRQTADLQSAVGLGY